jgi:hypothetical protein
MRNEGLYIYPAQGCPFIRDMTFHMSCLFIINNYLLLIYIYIFIYIYAMREMERSRVVENKEKVARKVEQLKGSLAFKFKWEGETFQVLSRRSHGTRWPCRMVRSRRLLGACSVLMYVASNKYFHISLCLTHGSHP